MKIKDDKNKFKGLSNIKNASTWFDVLKSDDRSAVLISCAAFDAKLDENTPIIVSKVVFQKK